MKIVEVDSVDLHYKQDGKYWEEYRGNFVFERLSGGGAYFFSTDGYTFIYLGSNNSSAINELTEPFRAAEVVIQQIVNEEHQKAKIGIDDLRALKKDFATSEILQLHEAGLI